MEPSFYAIIPANVRYDKELTANAKLLYGEITALCNKEGYCWASNDYFSSLYEVSKTSISKWISQLVSRGYLKSKIIYREGTKEIEERHLTLVTGGSEEKFNTPIEEKLKDNNTSSNNTLNKDKVSLPYKTNIDIQFFPEGWLEVWSNWLSYKSKIKSRYKTTISETKAFKNLIELSGSNKEKANKIILQSIENDWKGLFALKEESSGDLKTFNQYNSMEELLKNYSSQYTVIAYMFWKLWMSEQETKTLLDAKVEEWTNQVKNIIEVDGQKIERLLAIYQFFKQCKNQQSGYDTFWYSKTKTIASFRNTNQNGEYRLDLIASDVNDKIARDSDFGRLVQNKIKQFKEHQLPTT